MIAAAAFGAHPPALRDGLYAAGSGLGAAVALAALYRGMSVGAMGVVAPIAATGTVIPVGVGLLQGERPSPLQGVGVIVALLGVGVISLHTPSQDPQGPQADQRSPSAGSGVRRLRGGVAKSVWFGLIAAAGSGIAQVTIKEASAGGVLWLLIVQRVTVAVIALIAVRLLGDSLRTSASALRTLLVIGIADVVATGLFAAATTQGQLSVVAVIGALYPVVTVGLAYWVLSERLAKPQTAGVVAALIGTAAIAAGAH